MKLYLASFLEAKNFGPSGRIIGIVNGNKPNHVKCNFQFPHLTPKQEFIDTYKDMVLNDPKNAGQVFVSSFTKQLDEFYSGVLKTAEDSGKTPSEVLPFQDGDTLASWERGEFTNYRSLVAPYLVKLGYEVIIN